MKELTTEQIARVFALYYGCQFIDVGWEESREMLYPTKCPATCKLILRPLSAITDEDVIEVAKMYAFTPNYIMRIGEMTIVSDGQTEGKNPFPEGDQVIIDRNSVEYYNGIAYDGSESNINRYDTFQFLIQRGYAVPLFIAPNHPLNGKTALYIRES